MSVKLDDELLEAGFLFPGVPLGAVLSVKEVSRKIWETPSGNGEVECSFATDLLVETGVFDPSTDKSHFEHLVCSVPDGREYERKLMADRKMRALGIAGMEASGPMVELVDRTVPRLRALARTFMNVHRNNSGEEAIVSSLEEVLSTTNSCFDRPQRVYDFEEEDGSDEIISTPPLLERKRLRRFVAMKGLWRGICSAVVCWALLMPVVLAATSVLGAAFFVPSAIATGGLSFIVILGIMAVVAERYKLQQKLTLTKSELVVELGDRKQRINLATIQDVTYRRSYLRGFSDVFYLDIYTSGSVPNFYWPLIRVMGVQHPEQVREEIMTQRKSYVQSELKRRGLTLVQLEAARSALERASELLQSGGAQDSAVPAVEGTTSNAEGESRADPPADWSEHGPPLDDDVLASCTISSWTRPIFRSSYLLPWRWSYVSRAPWTLNLRTRVLEVKASTSLLIPLTEIVEAGKDNIDCMRVRTYIDTEGFSSRNTQFGWRLLLRCPDGDEMIERINAEIATAAQLDFERRELPYRRLAELVSVMNRTSQLLRVSLSGAQSSAAEA